MLPQLNECFAALEQRAEQKRTRPQFHEDRIAMRRAEEKRRIRVALNTIFEITGRVSDRYGIGSRDGDSL